MHNCTFQLKEIDDTSVLEICNELPTIYCTSFYNIANKSKGNKSVIISKIRYNELSTSHMYFYISAYFLKN